MWANVDAKANERNLTSRWRLNLRFVSVSFHFCFGFFLVFFTFHVKEVAPYFADKYMDVQATTIEQECCLNI